MTRADGIARADLKSEILRSLQRRDWAVSICPLQIARSLTGDKTWRSLLLRMRSLLAQIVRERRVVVSGARRYWAHRTLRVDRFESDADRSLNRGVSQNLIHSNWVAKARICFPEPPR